MHMSRSTAAKGGAKRYIDVVISAAMLCQLTRLQQPPGVMCSPSGFLSEPVLESLACWLVAVALEAVRLHGLISNVCCTC
jgi:hypothetical protein